VIEANDQHARFLKRLDASRPSVFKVAEWLHRQGFTIKVPSISYADYASEHLKHVDEGDLFIKKPNDADWMRVEVKHVSLEFDESGKWPFKTVIVSNKNAIDRADPLPVAYVLVNKSMTHGGIVYSKTKNEWSEKKILAKNTGNIETFYVCSPSILKFVKLGE